jgi:polar amino acid transport system substrate-binding protein
MTTMRARFLLPLIATILLAGCGTAAPLLQVEVANRAAPAATSAACKDGQPETASLSPGSIGTNPASWGDDSTMARIVRRGHLVVGTSGDARLWGARNPVNGRIEGYDVDVAAQVARELGLDPATTVYKVLTIAQRIPALQAGTVDLVAERMTISCDRWQGPATAPAAYVNLSTAYYVSGVRLLVRAVSTATSLTALRGQTVCGVAGSTSLEALGTADVRKLVVSETGKCLVAFQEGEAVAIVGDDTTLAGLASQDPYARIVGDPLSTSSVGFGLPAGATDLTRFVNAVLEKMRADGSLTDLYDQWMRPTVREPAPAVPAPVYGRDITALKRQS